MSKYQYRITVNGTQGDITDVYPGNERWSYICEVMEARGGYAKLERRLITDPGILPMVGNAKGYIQNDDNTVVCPWEVFAEADFVGS